MNEKTDAEIAAEWEGFHVERRELVVRMMEAGFNISREDAGDAIDNNHHLNAVGTMMRAADAAIGYFVEQLNGYNQRIGTAH